MFAFLFDIAHPVYLASHVSLNVTSFDVWFLWRCEKISWRLRLL